MSRWCLQGVLRLDARSLLHRSRFSHHHYHPWSFKRTLHYSAIASTQATSLPFNSNRNMPAQKIDGTAIAKDIREQIIGDIREKQKTNPRYNPSLVIIQGLSMLASPNYLLLLIFS
jgi:hypothetical protein